MSVNWFSGDYLLRHCILSSFKQGSKSGNNEGGDADGNHIKHKQQGILENS